MAMLEKLFSRNRPQKLIPEDGQQRVIPETDYQRYVFYEELFHKLGMNLTCEPVYGGNKLFHK